SAVSPPPAAVRFCFNGIATPALYALSLHDALPIYDVMGNGLLYPDLLSLLPPPSRGIQGGLGIEMAVDRVDDYLKVSLGLHKARSEEHTSELQSRENLVCRLLLEKKKHRAHAAIGK